MDCGVLVPGFLKSRVLKGRVLKCKVLTNSVLKKAGILALALFGGANGTAAAESVDKAVADQLRAALEQPSMNLKIEAIEATPISGMYEVKFLNGPAVYASENGQYFVLGDLHTVEGNRFVNLTEKKRDGTRLALLDKIDAKDMIIFPAEGETRGHISVFTDVTCFYCQKLHLEVPELNRMGVEVRYLAYPRGGVSSDGYRKLATAWCSENRRETLTKLKAKQSVAERVCEDNPVAEQFQIGQVAGVTGTPAIITADGQLIPGYKPAADLAADLGIR